MLKMSQSPAASLFLSVMFCAGLASAGTTGKIRGTVRDIDSGEALPGANVLIVNTSMGAATDASGNFVILNVPPGIYTVEARMIGYRTLARRNVDVDVDRTVTVDFALKQSAIEVGEIIIEAKRDLVQVDVAATENYITKEEYNATPFANRLEDIIALQSGVTGNLVEGEIKIREGEAHEIGLLVDGFSTVDPKFNRPIFTISPGAVQEIKIMRNGFNAEYGESRSGVINIVTRDPADDFHATLDYQLSPARRRNVGPSIYDPAVRWEYRLYDGPRAMEGDSLQLFEGRHVTTKDWIGWIARAQQLNTDANPNNDLTPEQARELWRWRHRPLRYGNDAGNNIDFSLTGPAKILPWHTNFLLGVKFEDHPFSFPQPRKSYAETSLTLKLINRLGENSRLTLFGVYSNVNSVPRSFSSSQWENEDLLSYNGGDQELFYPFRKPLIGRRAALFGAKFLHTISPSLYFEVNGSLYSASWDMHRAAQATEASGRVFNGRLYLDPQSGWIPKELGVDDLASGYRLYGGANTTDDSYSRRYELRASMTNQFHPNHELKAGASVIYDDLNEDRIHDHNDDAAQRFIWQYHVKPVALSAFVQDKIEFKGMIANIGVRWDLYDSNSDRPDVLRALESASDASIFNEVRDGSFPTIRPKARTHVSPRLGVSFPLTVSSKIFFNYGHFVSMPVNQALYSSTLDSGRPRVQWMGNPHLDFEKIIAYELGYDQNFSDRVQLHIGAYYKDYHDIVNGMVFAHSNQSLILEWPAQRFYREIRGIEIELRKSYGRFLTGFVNLNITKKSEANLTVPRFDSCCPIVTDDPAVGVNGELSGVPRPDISTIAPYARGIVTLSLPANWGPRLSGYSIFGRTQASLRLSYDGPSRIEHPSNQFRIDNPDIEFKTIGYFSSDLRLTRRFGINKMGFELYLDVSNFWVSKYRNLPSLQAAQEDYFNDLLAHGKANKVGSEEVSDPLLLRTESFDKYRGKLREYILGVRYNF